MNIFKSGLSRLVLVCFLVVISVQNTWAQVYHFDKLISYVHKFERVKETKSIYAVNTSNHNYYMEFIRYKDSLMAKISDYENYKTHIFFVSSLKSYEFIYQSTNQFSVTEIESLEPTRYEFKALKPKNGKKRLKFSLLNKNGFSYFSYKLTVKEIENDLTFVYCFNFADNPWLKYAIKGPFPLVVLESKRSNYVGHKSVQYLDSLEDISLNITVPLTDDTSEK